MSKQKENQYVTVRIPKLFDDLINQYIEAHREEMKLLDQRTSRAAIVKKALYEFLKKEGIIQQTRQSAKTQEETPKPDDFFVHIKETFLAHSIIAIVKEKTLPPDHSDLKQLEQNIRQYITERAEKEGKEITKQRLDELTEDLIEYHKEILEGLNLMTRH